MRRRVTINRARGMQLCVAGSFALLASCTAPDSASLRQDASLDKMLLSSAAQDGLQKYQTTVLQDFRAFAVNPSTGRSGRSWFQRTPKEAMDDAVNFCERTGEECMIYALGDAIVSGMSSVELAAAAEKYYVAVSPAMAQVTEGQLVGVRLSSEEITAHLSERTMRGKNFNGMQYEGIWRSDGVMKAEATLLHLIERVPSDIGTWTVEEGKLCRQWEHWSGGRRECLVVTKEGNTLRAYDVHGDVIELIILVEQE